MSLALSPKEKENGNGSVKRISRQVAVNASCGKAELQLTKSE
jgi:hypothetical protein